MTVEKTNPFELMEDRFDRLEGLVIELINKKAPNQEKESYLTRKEVAQLLKISLPTLHKRTVEGSITGYRFGERILYKASEIDSVIKNGKL